MIIKTVQFSDTLKFETFNPKFFLRMDDWLHPEKSLDELKKDVINMGAVNYNKTSSYLNTLINIKFPDFEALHHDKCKMNNNQLKVYLNYLDKKGREILLKGLDTEIKALKVRIQELL